MSFLFPSSTQYRKENSDIMNPSATETQQQFALNKCAQPTSLFDSSNIPKDGSCWEQSSPCPMKQSGNLLTIQSCQ